MGELPEYLSRRWVKRLCDEHGVRFTDLVADLGVWERYESDRVLCWLGY